MMLCAVTALALSLAEGAPSTPASPHCAQDSPRPLKTLTPEQVQGYSSGEGMGLAKAAELNAYPGPKHVLDLAAPLRLSPEQRAAVQEAYDAMHEKAVGLGTGLLAKERELDEQFAGHNIGSASLSALVGEIARLQGQLRLSHLEAHLKTRDLLSDAQIAAYQQLRGYDKAPPAH